MRILSNTKITRTNDFLSNEKNIILLINMLVSKLKAVGFRYKITEESVCIIILSPQ